MLTVAEAKAIARIDAVDEDIFVASLIQAATAHVERITGVSCNSRSFQKASRNVVAPIALSPHPVTAVTAIERVGPNGTTSAADWFDVDLTERPARIVPLVEVRLDPRESIRVTFTAGTNDPPPDLKQAAGMLIAHWFENREAAVAGAMSSEVALGVQRLTAPWMGLRLA